MLIELTDTSKAEKLFAGWEETLILSCLQKVMGKIYVTEPESPRAAAAQLGDFVFLAGEPERELVLDWPGSFAILTPRDGRWTALIRECWPEAETWERYAIRKDTRFRRDKLERMAAALPEGYALRRIDAELYELCLADPLLCDFVRVFGSKENYLALGRGVAVVKDGRVVSGASSYTRWREGIEIEVDTVEAERRKGLACAACAALILDCLDEGLYPSWDAANMASVHLAEKLGYEYSHRYFCYAARRP